MNCADSDGAAKTAAPENACSGRRRFLKGAAGSAVAGFPMIAVAQQPIVLRLQGAWLARDIFHEYALDFAKKINDMAGGRLRVDMLPAGTVAKPQDLLEAVHRGAIDGCHAVSSSWHNRNSAFSLFGAGPTLGMDANTFLAWMRYGGGMELYTDLVHRQLNLNVMPFFTGPMPAQPLVWFRKPVKSPADFKGLRIRSSALAADVLGKMGAIPVALADGDVVAAMRRGEIDAAELSNPSADRWLGMPDVAKNCMLRSYHKSSEVFEVLITRTRFAALPAELQAIVRHAADAASADMSWKALRRYPEDQAVMRDAQGVRFYRTPPTVQRAQLQAWEAVMTRIAGGNPFFEKVWQSQANWARRTAGWLRDTTPDAAMAYDFWFGGAGRKPQPSSADRKTSR